MRFLRSRWALKSKVTTIIFLPLPRTFYIFVYTPSNPISTYIVHPMSCQFNLNEYYYINYSNPTTPGIGELCYGHCYCLHRLLFVKFAEHFVWFHFSFFERIKSFSFHFRHNSSITEIFWGLEKKNLCVFFFFFLNTFFLFSIMWLIHVFFLA